MDSNTAETVQVMRSMRADFRVFGHIPGFPVGSTWSKRRDCGLSGVHPGIFAGIYGSQDEGAYSVALSGGYEDDVDEGETFTYTGCGGRDLKSPSGKARRTGPQCEDQTWGNRYNRSLQRSSETGRPVRVVRGYKLDSIYAPADGYRYDGLYRVTRAWREQGRAGFLVCRCTFERLSNQPPLPRLRYELNLDRLQKSARVAERRRKKEANMFESLQSQSKVPGVLPLPSLLATSSSISPIAPSADTAASVAPDASYDAATVLDPPPSGSPLPISPSAEAPMISNTEVVPIWKEHQFKFTKRLYLPYGVDPLEEGELLDDEDSSEDPTDWDLEEGELEDEDVKPKIEV